MEVLPPFTFMKERCENVVSTMILELVQSMIMKIFSGGQTQSVIDTVLIDTTGTSFTGIWSNITHIYQQFLVPFGLAILIFMFFFCLMEKMSTTEVSFSVIGKMVCQFLLLAAFLEIALDVALAITHFSNILSRGIAGVVTIVKTTCEACGKEVPIDEFCSECLAPLGNSDVVSKVLEAFYGTPTPHWSGFLAGLDAFRESFIPIIVLFVPWLVTIICEVLIKCIMLTRQIEIFVRAAFLPVALGDGYNGLHSSGFRYAKTFLAICLQGSLIIIILSISDVLSSSYLLDVINGTFLGVDGVMSIVIMPIIYRIAATGLIMKSFPLAKEICGVH